MEVRYRIESETDLRTSLDTLYEKSKEGKSFNGLLEMIMNEHTIITAVHDIKSNKGSKTPGIDGKTINDYLQMPREDLLSLVKRHLRNYKPKPVKRKYIPKGNDTTKVRPLGIPTMLDRIIQQCVKIVLEPILEAKFYPHSYGFRPNRSTHHAISRICHLMNMGRFKYVIEGDIKGYFDNIDHSILINKLKKAGIIDSRVLAIIRKMLGAGVMEDMKYHSTDTGSPQGGIISPLLANVYLNDFDWMMSSKYEHPYFEQQYSDVKNARRKYRKVGRKPVFLVRYADDWVLFVHTKEQAQKYLKELNKYFENKLKLSLSKEKTIITNLEEDYMNFLGFSIKYGKPVKAKTRTGNKRKHELSAKVLPNVKKVRSKLATILTDIKKLRRVTCEYQTASEIETINSKIIGLAEYYKISIWTEMFDSFDHSIFKTCHYTWKRKFRNQNSGKDKSYVKRYNELANRVQRHSEYTAHTHAIEVEGLWIGFAKFSHTPSEDPMNFNQNMTPYTEKGRKLYLQKAKKKSKLDRPPLYYGNADIFRIAKANGQSKRKTNKKYNFEYYMNREYAFNRDKGKCKICELDILPIDLHTHHINNRLPLDEINKVKNLASVHHWCHSLIHGTDLPESLNGKTKKRVETYRKKLKG
ncbi:MULTISPECIES: group II intron reverse transcriptase/maturase [Bacillus]|uniref:group II intron reverse transcriptase/maturase n=1 Tax=Bacillus TaxID=1386 RepID=UPI000A30397F|nr:group II intron reverse transcriptase/maturase [Bacillus paranthracis]MCC2493461.1 group II intron reverse transcriptase/maturase [Bacillus cereus]MCC2501755.1 group II intron reverse transcriptase/maturase [Bacillus paranthracis]MCU5472776.1 group II intron reverse transcriptase/maturase [Bacillus paranthracis]MED1217079.1 group II intron reverse transcriptase/maturase [Bacillus paranthracis]SMD82287.1 Group II intron-encoded protein LtrA [Bacillus cereus]